MDYIFFNNMVYITVGVLLLVMELVSPIVRLHVGRLGHVQSYS